MGIKTGDVNQLATDQESDMSIEMLMTIMRNAQEIMSGTGWLDGVNALLREVGELTKVSRVWIFQTLELKPDYILQDYIFEWAAEEKYIQIGLPHFSYFDTQIDQPAYTELIQSRQRGEYQHMVIDALPDGWLKNYLESQKIKSMLTIPIMVDNKWWGTLGLDDCERAIRWQENEITLLTAASYFIASAIVQDSWRATKNQLDVLKASNVCSSWELDTRRGHLWCTSEIISNLPNTTNSLIFTLRDWLRIIHPEHRSILFDTIRKFLIQPDQPIRCDLKIKTNSGEYRWIEVCADAPKQKCESGDLIAGIFWDITKRKEQEEHLREQAMSDPLTGLMNRRNLESLLLGYQNEVTPKIINFAMLDLDHFKRINDRYGHGVGDEVLKHFAHLCRDMFANKGYVARIGGEEFAILLPDMEQTQAYTLLHELLDKVSATHLVLGEHRISYTISVGMSTVMTDKLNILQLFERADSAMYLTKNRGRSGVSAIEYDCKDDCCTCSDNNCVIAVQVLDSTICGK